MPAFSTPFTTTGLPRFRASQPRRVAARLLRAARTDCRRSRARRPELENPGKERTCSVSRDAARRRSSRGRTTQGPHPDALRGQSVRGQGQGDRDPPCQRSSSGGDDRGHLAGKQEQSERAECLCAEGGGSIAAGIHLLLVDLFPPTRAIRKGFIGRFGATTAARITLYRRISL